MIMVAVVEREIEETEANGRSPPRGDHEKPRNLDYTDDKGVFHRASDLIPDRWMTKKTWYGDRRHTEPGLPAGVMNAPRTCWSVVLSGKLVNPPAPERPRIEDVTPPPGYCTAADTVRTLFMRACRWMEDTYRWWVRADVIAAREEHELPGILAEARRLLPTDDDLFEWLMGLAQFACTRPRHWHRPMMRLPAIIARKFLSKAGYRRLKTAVHKRCNVSIDEDYTRWFPKVCDGSRIKQRDWNPELEIKQDRLIDDLEQRRPPRMDVDKLLEEYERQHITERATKGQEAWLYKVAKDKLNRASTSYEASYERIQSGDSYEGPGSAESVLECRPLLDATAGTYGWCADEQLLGDGWQAQVLASVAAETDGVLACACDIKKVPCADPEARRCSDPEAVRFDIRRAFLGLLKGKAATRKNRIDHFLKKVEVLYPADDVEEWADVIRRAFPNYPEDCLTVVWNSQHKGHRVWRWQHE